MAGKDMMQVKHTKRGMNKLIKNIYLLQLNYVSIGIHRRDNRLTSGTRQSTALNKKGQSKSSTKTSFDKSSGSGAGDGSSPNNQSQGSGLDQSSSKKSGGGSKTRKRGFNLATLAYYLEQSVSWVQRTAVTLNGVGGTFHIQKGTRLTRPARVFIRLFKLPDIWQQIRKSIQIYVRSFFMRSGVRAREFWVDVGRRVKVEQQGIISRRESEPNAALTELLKGKNHPLFDTGGLFNAINYKVEKNYSTGAKKIQRQQFLMNMNREMGKLK